MKADFPRYHIEDLPSFLFENKINEKIKIISTHPVVRLSYHQISFFQEVTPIITEISVLSL